MMQIRVSFAAWGRHSSLLVASILLASSAWAQSSSTDPATGKTAGSSGAKSGQAEIQQPYVAHLKTTNAQVMPNGKTTTHEILRTRAVDSNGRTVDTESQTFVKGEPPQVTVRVSDPIENTQTSWSSGTQRADVLKLPPSDQQKGCWQSDSGRIRFDLRKPAGSSEATQAKDISGARKEDLGTTTIQGIEAHGQRWTLTIPAGQIGNAKPVTVIAESWMAPSLGIEVRHINDDGQGTRSLMELESIQFAEPPASGFRPPASGFRPPAGYTIATEQMHEVKCPESGTPMP